jgi:hypothetical protein
MASLFYLVVCDNSRETGQDTDVTNPNIRILTKIFRIALQRSYSLLSY